MKKKKSWRWEWMMFSTGVIFLVMAQMILPYYEKIATVAGVAEQGEKGVFFLRWGMTILALILLCGFLFRLISRWRGRNKGE